PLVTRSRTLGAMTFLARTPRRYGAADLALAMDLARRAALAVENARLYEESQEGVRRRDEFLARLAPELRNPLAAIQSAAAAAKLKGVTDPELCFSQEVIERQGKHMARLLDDLLDISRVMHGKIQLCPEPVNLGELVEGALQ